ncbi:MAG: hypothetical protein AVDCRST_MAG18-1221 [uncultured Thermomicrobiales bacterium]|uniref:DUF5808 domain-containing protein n=1 Tax=uncultured Thermomicrobiales bacterium TaxID=1645740 RepID=A0A6J4UZR9_9BACT|nr:MAG: hypothetical protein AVDCRST_MAG18-1221 [uncultured Thermomicrobiales bacterium]
MGFLKKIVQLVVLLVLVQALREQLERDPEERTWQGRVGPVPYDFRVPTLDGVLNAYWNPDSQQLFTDKVVGIGWAINFAQLWRIVNELRQQYREMAAYQ